MNSNALNKDAGKDAKASCSSSSTLNFSVGVIAVVAAIVIGYLVYTYFAKS